MVNLVNISIAIISMLALNSKPHRELVYNCLADASCINDEGLVLSSFLLHLA